MTHEVLCRNGQFKAGGPFSGLLEIRRTIWAKYESKVQKCKIIIFFFFNERRGPGGINTAECIQSIKLKKTCVKFPLLN